VAAAASSCTLEPGTVPYRREIPTSRIEDYSAPGSIVTLGPAEKNIINCPHCGARNKLGETNCETCDRRLTRRPQWKPCPRCAGKYEEDQPLCEVCGGRGWIRELPPEGAPDESEEDETDTE
jgi:hypothetical protein